MKKIVILLAAILLATVSSYASNNNSKMSVGAEYNISTKGGCSGVGFQLEYELFDHIRVAPEFIYSFANGSKGHFTNLNVNVEYVIDTNSGFDFYPMAGLAYVNSGKEEGNKNNFGFNAGCGVEFNLSNRFTLFGEETFQMVKNSTRFITAIGVKYAF
ncbi:MAG: outer membrane beta-barrel protein [Bacteroidales bacterium]|nr:outer membrane beta-barrel protein [Bacteroidales bacterium]